MATEIYLSDTTNEVRLRGLGDGRYLAEALPVLQVGTWNGRSYTADDLKAMVANFQRVQAADKWDPPMRPFHGYDSEGHPLIQDARDTVGWFKNLQYDEATERLLADVEIVDEQSARDMLSGKLRYISAEVLREGYTSATGEEVDGPVLMGAAWVTNPAVKGMPWSIVTNAADYSKTADDDQPLPIMDAITARKAGDKMPSFIEALRMLFTKAGVPETDTAELDQFASVAPAEPDGGDAEKTQKGDDTMDNLTESLQAQLEQLQQAKAESEKRIEQLELQARTAEVKGAVETWVASGIVPPALRVPVYALAERLAAADVKLEVLADDAGTTRTVRGIDLLHEILKGMKPDVQSEPRAALWQGTIDQAINDNLSDEEIAKAVERLTGHKS